MFLLVCPTTDHQSPSYHHQIARYPPITPGQGIGNCTVVHSWPKESGHFFARTISVCLFFIIITATIIHFLHFIKRPSISRRPIHPLAILYSMSSSVLAIEWLLDWQSQWSIHIIFAPIHHLWLFLCSSPVLSMWMVIIAVERTEDSRFLSFIDDNNIKFTKAQLQSIHFTIRNYCFHSWIHTRPLRDPLEPVLYYKRLSTSTHPHPLESFSSITD